jgi:predicted AAA+ superfamily ATPase
MANQENPFIFGEIIEEPNFVNRTAELQQLVRDLADGQKVFLLSPRRFGKSSLVALALLKLQKRHIRTVSLTSAATPAMPSFWRSSRRRCCAPRGPGSG